MREFEAGIIHSEFRGDTIYLIELSCETIAQDVVPGQFVQVRAGCGTDPFLRRTFSVCTADPKKGVLTLMIEIKGEGTELICSIKRGRTLNVIGPLGQGFDLKLGGDGTSFLVAGGMGAVPLVFLAQVLKHQQKRKIVLLTGARTSERLRVFKRLLDTGTEVLYATNDGSLGFHGMVHSLLEQTIFKEKPAALYTCGPLPMMRAVSKIAYTAGIPCQVSLEERMACGVGACYGCVVQFSDGRMVRTCIDGPVFCGEEIDW